MGTLWMMPEASVLVFGADFFLVVETSLQNIVQPRYTTRVEVENNVIFLFLIFHVEW